MLGNLKALFLLLLVNVIGISQNNALVIFSETGTPFYLILNGEKINKNAESNVKVADLASGWQRLEINVPGIVKEPTYKDSILLSDKSKFVNKEFTYVLVKKSEKLQLQFKSVSELSGPKTPPIPDAPKETAPLVDNSIYGNLYQAVKNKPVFYENYDKENNTCKYILNDKEIKYAISLMQKANDREASFRYLTKIIEYNCYSTIQVEQLIETSPIDMDKLNLAKKAYTHLTDRQNASTLSNLLKYQAMKDSYADFLKEQKDIDNQKKLNCSEPLSETKFNDLYNKINVATYETDKLKVSKKLLTEVCLSSSQVKKIGELFTHDREKLDYMKYALNIITDKENTQTLSDEFQFQSTKEEFLKYIKQ